jgi:hypothetical protein
MTSVIRRNMRGLLGPLVPAIVLATLLTAGCQAGQQAPAAHNPPAAGQGAGQAAPASGATTATTTAPDTSGQAGNVAPNSTNPACKLLQKQFAVQGILAEDNQNGVELCTLAVSLDDAANPGATVPVTISLYTLPEQKTTFDQFVGQPRVVAHHNSIVTIYDLTGGGVQGFAYGPSGSNVQVIQVMVTQKAQDASLLVVLIGTAYLALAHPQA